MAMFNLAELYADGKGVAKDMKAAKEWYEKAAAAGCEEAKEALEKLSE